MRKRLARLFRRPAPYGGQIRPCKPESDSVMAVLTPGRSTVLRPGETHVEAMNRLLEGEDL